jgi:hypothetical protein
MKKIKRLEPVSVMRISALAYGVLGLLEGVVFGVFLFLAPVVGPNSRTSPRVFGPVLGVLAIIFLPILFAAMGAIMGGLSAVTYNLAAKYVGGIQVEVE